MGNPADANRGIILLVISEDMIIRGITELHNCRQLEIHGYVEGVVTAGAVRIHKTGKCYGSIKSESAEVLGTLQGNVTVRNLINIHSSGSVRGNVHYGKLALEAGGNLSAEVRNVPPSIGGDLDLTVEKGRAISITLQDLTALDPDDEAKDLVFTISNAKNGFVAPAPARPVTRFTQADLERGNVVFRHDGTNTSTASFNVVVAHHTGATSGAPQTVKVDVRA
jgi:cytoskeletal protein CcmA (bactofilin family)